MRFVTFGLVAALCAVFGGWGASSASAQEDEDLAATIARLGKTRWTAGNSVELLADPRRAWEARLDLLEATRNHVFISTFSWREDEYGDRFRAALSDVVRQRSESFPGFLALCLADATGLKLFSRSFDDVRAGGAVVRPYNRLQWGMAPAYDGRMHDKLLISDGRQAIVGGRNYSDIYFDPQRWWLDFGVLVEGPAAWDLQMIFLKSWVVSSDLVAARHFGWPLERIERRFRSLWSTGRYPNGKSPLEDYMNERFFPSTDEAPGETRLAVLYDNSMVWDRAPTASVMVEMVRRAETEIDIMTPFPNFETELTAALIDAVNRGVRVRLITNDREAAIRGGGIRLAAYPTLIKLAEGGAEVWAWKANPKLLEEVVETECAPSIMPPVALHGKVARFDDELTIVHSSNFNIRSTYYNTEAGLAVLDREFNAQMKGILDGLVTLLDFDLRCTNGNRQVIVDKLVKKLEGGDVAVMQGELGGKQRFLDGMSMLW